MPAKLLVVCGSGDCLRAWLSRYWIKPDKGLLIMAHLRIKKPVSLGILLTYKCNIACRDCIYNSSPAWPSDWMNIEDVKLLLKQLSVIIQKPAWFQDDAVSFFTGIHLTGGEPFLNYGLLREITRLSRKVSMPAPFVETNAFWASEDRKTEKMLQDLKNDGLKGILVSVNPFNIEKIPFKNTERAAYFSSKIFGRNAIIYQRFYYDLFRSRQIEGTLPFEEFLSMTDPALLNQHTELLPMGRTPYRLGHLFHHHKASAFFKQSCYGEITRNHHIHIDNYMNYIPVFCAGISLGDARQMDRIFSGIDLQKRPVLRRLLKSIEDLYRLGQEYGFQEDRQGYISKCHLCFEIRRHLVQSTKDFPELQPTGYYRLA